MTKTYYEKYLKIISILIFLLALSGCYEYEKNISDARDNKHKHPEQRFFDGEAEPPFPDENENGKTLLGVDVNYNGIRDDVEIWINFIGKDYNHRMALKMLARSEVKRLIAGDKRIKALKTQAAKDYWDAFLCVRYIEKSIYGLNNYPSLDLLEVVYNTESRIHAYKYLESGSVVYESNNKNLEAGTEYSVCDFKIENLDLVIQNHTKALEELRFYKK